MRIASRLLSFWLVILMSLFHPAGLAFAAAGDSAAFSFVPLNGKAGENEVKLVVNTDSAAINHLIFDIVDPADSLVFDMDGVGDPVSFPLSGQSVLGTQTTFTTASGDKGYDIASSNPANTGSYSALHFATLVADSGLPTGAGGVLAFDTDTAIYVNAARKGSLGANYTVLPNAAPIISAPLVDGTSLSLAVVAPSNINQTPATLVQNVSTTPTFTFTVTDSTDASVTRTAKVYKRLSDGTWGYPSSATKTVTQSRSGSNLTYSGTFSGGNALDFSSYYKLEFIATDDQGASDTMTRYFATQADNVAPSQVGKAFMTFISDSNTRSNVISQISFTTSTDNAAVSNYYLWTKSYLISKDIINSDGTRDLALDTDFSYTISDEEFFVGLRGLVNDGKYVATMTAAQAGSTPYFRITGDNVDQVDDNGTIILTSDDIYMVPDSIAEDIFYIVSADNAQTVSGSAVPNFGAFQIVNKVGDIFGAQTSVTIGSNSYSFSVGDGSLDVWDAIFLYRSGLGQAGTSPVLVPDMLHSSLYSYPSNTSISGATAN